MSSTDQTQATAVQFRFPLAQAFGTALLTLMLALPLQASPAFGAGPIGYDDEDDSGNEALAQAVKMVNQGSYTTAVALLQKAMTSNPYNPDALSLLGYSKRKLGEREAALGYYARALKLDPKHLGANEYLGELYLEMDDLAGAEERLGVLETACGTGCEEYQQLAKAIAAFKSGR